MLHIHHEKKTVHVSPAMHICNANLPIPSTAPIGNQKKSCHASWVKKRHSVQKIHTIWKTKVLFQSKVMTIYVIRLFSTLKQPIIKQYIASIWQSTVISKYPLGGSNCNNQEHVSQYLQESCQFLRNLMVYLPENKGNKELMLHWGM